MKGNVVETVIGAAVIAIAVVFFTYVYKTADIRAGSGGYTVIANFENVDGITTGSDVRVSGVPHPQWPWPFQSLGWPALAGQPWKHRRGLPLLRP